MGWFFRKGFRFRRAAFQLEQPWRRCLREGRARRRAGRRRAYVSAGREGIYYHQNIGRRRPWLGWLLLLLIAGALVAWLAV